MRPLLASLCMIAFLGMTQLALAHSYKQGDISIGHIWTRATPSGSTTAAVYVPLLNTGTEVDTLVGASTSLADKVEIHEETKTDHIMKMQMMDTIELEPNKPVSLRPNGMHLMVIGLKKPLKEGDKLPLTLEFAKAGKIDVDVMVEAAGAAAASH